jgi:ribosomal protein RSM22 (predicted rRNA methylase)
MPGKGKMLADGAVVSASGVGDSVAEKIAPPKKQNGKVPYDRSAAQREREAEKRAARIAAQTYRAAREASR